MESKIRVLAKTLELMMANADDNGNPYIQPILSDENVRIILRGLSAIDRPIDSTLADTIDDMLNPDYRERFKAEYQQTKIRYEKLKAFNTKIKAAHMSTKVDMPAHDCPEELLREQQAVIGQYLHLLELRAEIEFIDL